jgi:hypothetical protein
MTRNEYKDIDCGMYLVYKFGTQIENEDQTQDEDEVQVLVIIGDHLVEKKGLKE